MDLILKKLLEIKKNTGITQRWITDKVQSYIPEITEDKISRKFLGKADITGYELLVLAKVLNIDLNELRDQIDKEEF